MSDWRAARKIVALQRRALMLEAVRRFFSRRGYLEVETPNRIPAPAPEHHVDAVACGGWYLHTSPELAMKRLLAVGFPPLFQICKCYRDAERGDRHLPEFSMLEWYRPGADYRFLMTECEELICFVASELGLGFSIPFRGGAIDLGRPWPVLTVREAFARFASLSLDEALCRDVFDETLALEIEPHLSGNRPLFLCDYPLALGSLARSKAEDPSVAERFELYLGGLEIANAFSELIDAVEQRRRFAEANDFRVRTGRNAYALSEPFLQALAEMPASAGIALGIDRLAMIFTDSHSIDDVVCFVPEDL
ncbi:MAG TPA: EF-P lysine aminoacylase EpmA [Syntrophales bacterium]|nr:EF-P lysine aminoacylase EpmA [Syntrophales bacterium]